MRIRQQRHARRMIWTIHDHFMKSKSIHPPAQVLQIARRLNLA